MATDQRVHDTPRVSIVMPVLNCAEYLGDAIESVLSQSLTCWELLIMDGVSNDGSVDVARGYRDQRIRISQEPDEGIPHAWDKGVRRARGDHIALLCGNDAYMDKEFLMSCVDTMDSDPEVSLVWGVPCWLVGGEYSLNPRPWGQFAIHPERIDWYQKQKWLTNWLGTGVGFWDGGMCTRREVYMKCMPPYELGTGVQDKLFPFFYNFNTQGYLPFGLPRVVSFYRLHGDNTFGTATDAIHLSVQDYARRVRRYRADLIAGRRVHVYRDGNGQPLGILRWPEQLTKESFFVTDGNGQLVDGTKQLETAFPRA